MSDLAPGESNFRCIQEFAEDCRTLYLDSFRARHGDAFLLGHVPVATDSSLVPQTTVKVEETAGGRFIFNPRQDMLVIQVRRRRKPLLQGFVSVGRTKGTDLVIPDLTISRFHASFLKGEDERFYLQDAGNRNGTFVNDDAVPPRGQGDPVPIESGVQLRFGSVEFTFLGVVDFRKLVISLFGDIDKEIT